MYSHAPYSVSPVPIASYICFSSMSQLGLVGGLSSHNVLGCPCELDRLDAYDHLIAQHTMIKGVAKGGIDLFIPKEEDCPLPFHVLSLAHRRVASTHCWTHVSEELLVMSWWWWIMVVALAAAVGSSC